MPEEVEAFIKPLNEGAATVPQTALDKLIADLGPET